MKHRRTLAELLEPRRLLAANVVISEFLASNNNGITDSFGAHSDWIEIHNAGDATADLHDYFLTDDAGDPEKWRFPEQNLAAGAYLVVFASGDNLATAGSELHTNFKIGADGEYLGLINASNDTPQFEYAPTFPPQTSDVSYGLYNADDPNSAGLFRQPDSRAQNNPTAQAPTYSVQGKTFTGTLPVSLSSTTPGAVIHYTTDGSVPTASSTVYSTPLSLTLTTMLRTLVTAAGYGASPVTSQSYIALNSTASTTSTLGSSSVSTFTSNLPIVMIDTFGTPISDTVDNATSMSFIDTTNGTASAWVRRITMAGRASASAARPARITRKSNTQSSYGTKPTTTKRNRCWDCPRNRIGCSTHPTPKNHDAERAGVSVGQRDGPLCQPDEIRRSVPEHRGHHIGYGDADGRRGLHWRLYSGREDQSQQQSC